MYHIHEWPHGQNIYLCTMFTNGPMVRAFIYVLCLLLGWGQDFKVSNWRVEDMKTRRGGAIEWIDKSNCKYEMAKSASVGFSRQMELKPFEPRKHQSIP